MKAKLLWSARKWRLFMALVVAAACSDLFDRETWRRVTSALDLLWGLWSPETEVDQETYAYRMDTCRMCPLFFAPLQTCGSPMKNSLRHLGCYCNMETKAGLKAATCWLDDNLPGKYGWKANESRRNHSARGNCGVCGSNG